MSERTVSRVAPTVATLIGAVVGLLVTIPVGTTEVLCDRGGTSRCQGSVQSILITVTGDHYPGWIPVAGLLVGALIGWLVWFVSSEVWGRGSSVRRG